MVKFTDLIVLFIVILSLLFPHLACKTNDTASYQADNVTLLAKNISPDCPAPEDPNACAWKAKPSLYERVDGEFNAQYLGNRMWSVTKTCPIFSQYNENWYFYEDDNKLASKLLYPKETEKPEEGTQQTSAISEQSKGEKLNTLYVNINENLQQSYTLCQQLQDFDWSSIEYLSWQSKDENGNEHIIVMKDMLLSKEAVQLLLTQSDRCNALAVKLWLENPYKKPTDFNSQQITPAAWYRWYTTTPQLEVEIGKAQDLANNIVSDTSKKLEAIDSSLNIPGSISDAYIQEIHTKYSDYLTLLDYAIQYFESARALALEIRR